MPTAREQESILICTQCGHNNPVTNKFCGNCGNEISIFDQPPAKTIDKRQVVCSRVITMPDLTTPTAAIPEPPPRHQVAPREARRGVAPEPTVVETRQAYREEPFSPISGPSFLGLSSDPIANADYVLAHEDHMPGAFRFLIILAIIALIVTGALEWRAIRKMVAEQRARFQSSPAADLNQTQPAAASSDAAPPVASDTQPASSTLTGTAPQTGSTATGADVQPAHPLVKMDFPPPSGQQSQSAKESLKAAPSQTAPGPTAVARPATKVERASQTPMKPTAASIPAKPAQEPPKEKLDSAKDPDVLRAEKYLYGHGVPQNCTAAKSLLQQAAGRQNPSAMSQLGAMYATGRCV
jgi:hypothetical protein